MVKKLVVFDLDGTLAESKADIDGEMASLLSQLLIVEKVAIISGGAWPQFDHQVLTHLPKGTHLSELSILPTCGTKFFRFDERWRPVYSEDLSAEQRKQIIDALHKAVDEAGLKPEKLWGDQIEDRGSQITFSALGQQAPLDAKKDWDPNLEKRKKLQVALKKLLPEFAVNIGGSTSIDVTKPGIDKAYGIRKLKETLRIEIDEMIFVGDAIYPGGNDYPAKQAGVFSIKVRDPDETKRVIEAILACESGQVAA